MSSEFARIEQLAALFARPSEEVPLAIGDDCAVLAPSALPRVWTIDAAIEGVHFSRAFMALDAVGFRAFMAAASDIAAMGGRAVAALSAWVLPVSFSDAELASLAQGLARAADACACAIVGGNLTRGGELSLTTSVLGECAGRVLTRAGARPGDAVFVTGTVGGAALGLRALERGWGREPRFAAAVANFVAPRARVDVASAIAALGTAAIDVSDGLLQDLGHLCRASQVGARIEAGALPLLPDFAARAAELALDPRALALQGGEDYELVFTAPRARVPSTLATCIGEVVAPEAGVLAVDERGTPLALGAGFDHFAR